MHGTPDAQAKDEINFVRKSAKEVSIGSLSSDVFERRVSTGSGLFAQSCDFKQTFGQIVFIRAKKLSHTNLVALSHIKGD